MNFKKLERSGIVDEIKIDGIAYEPEELAEIMPYEDISSIDKCKLYTGDYEIYLEEVEEIDDLMTEALLKKNHEGIRNHCMNEITRIYDEAKQRALHPEYIIVGTKR